MQQTEHEKCTISPNLPVAKALLQYNADPNLNLKDDFSRDALYYAASNSEQLVQCLIDSGVHVSIGRLMPTSVRRMSMSNTD